MMAALEIYVQHGEPPRVDEFTCDVVELPCYCGPMRLDYTGRWTTLCERCEELASDPWWELKQEKFKLRGVNRRLKELFSIQ